MNREGDGEREREGERESERKRESARERERERERKSERERERERNRARACVHVWEKGFGRKIGRVKVGIALRVCVTLERTCVTLERVCVVAYSVRHAWRQARIASRSAYPPLF